MEKDGERAGARREIMSKTMCAQQIQQIRASIASIAIVYGSPSSFTLIPSGYTFMRMQEGRANNKAYF